MTNLSLKDATDWVKRHVLFNGPTNYKPTSYIVTKNGEPIFSPPKRCNVVIVGSIPKLLIKFDAGDYNIKAENIGLTTLENLPTGGHLSELVISGNNFVDLKGCPSKIFALTVDNCNKLRSLEGCASHVNVLNIQNNPKLKDLSFLPSGTEVVRFRSKYVSNFSTLPSDIIISEFIAGEDTAETPFDCKDIHKKFKHLSFLTIDSSKVKNVFDVFKTRGIEQIYLDNFPDRKVVDALQKMFKKYPLDIRKQYLFDIQEELIDLGLE